MEQRRRTVGAILGLLRGPVLVGVIVMIYLDVMGPLVPAGAGNLAPRGVLEHLQVPVTILGGRLLGIALARWVRLPGTLPAVIIALWFGTLAFGRAGAATTGTAHGVPWFVLLRTWLLSDDTLAMRSPVSQEMWHLVYLLGLSLLAGVAALLHAPGERRPLLAAGVVLVLVTALAGWLQLG